MPQQTRNHQKSLLLLFNLISCLTILIFAVIIYQQSRTSKNYGDWVRHTYQVLNVSHQIMNGASEMESSYRGYFLTGSDSFVAQIPIRHTQVSDNIAILKNIAAVDSAQQKYAEEISNKFQLFKRLLEQQDETYKQFGASGLVISDINASRRAMSELQAELGSFIQAENVKLEHRLFLENFEHQNQISTIIIGAGISILSLILSNILISMLMSSAERTSRRLASVQELYEVIQDNINDGLYDFNLVTEKITFSPSYRKQLGYKADELNDVDAGLVKLLHPEDVEKVLADLESFKSGGDLRYTNTYRMKHRNGSWLWMLSRAVATRDQQNRLIRMVGIHTDITAQKKQEIALRDLNNEMESFTYIASHDLRSPLVNLKGFAKEIDNSIKHFRVGFAGTNSQISEQGQRMLTDIFDKDIPESLSFIDSAVERMDILTGAILNLSRIGRRNYNPVWVSVNDVVSRCIKALSYEINLHKTVVNVDDLPEIYADELAIEQIFSNVLENAVKYLDPARSGHIAISGLVSMDEILYSITDNGRGIEEKDAEKIFSIFRRARNTTDVRGVGMGLAFVKATVRKMGGHIWYDSKLQHGTRFNISLPHHTTKDELHEYQQ